MIVPARPGTASRSHAARIVALWLERGAFPDHLVESIVSDRAFVTELAYGVIRNYRSLDFLRGRLASRRPAPELDALLLVGLYQVFHLEGVEPHAAVFETVEAAKGGRNPKAAGFVNAILRRAIAERDALLALLARQSLGTRESHPDGLLDRWRRHMSEARVEALCAWDNSKPEVTLRVETDRVDLERFLALLRDATTEARAHPARPNDVVILPRGAVPSALPGYAEGFFAVQDPSTLMAVDLVDPRPGESILDLCAAPGGKSFAMAARMQDRGVVFALDADSDRVRVLAENAARLRRPVVRCAECDVTQGGPLPEGVAERSFDAVLLDVPCTNTGVLRRRPDARWRWTPERLEEALRLQRTLLDAGARFVKPGGRLIYSTCSLEPEENAGQVSAFRARTPAFHIDIERQNTPPESAMDGAYAARLRRADC